MIPPHFIRNQPPDGGPWSLERTDDQGSVATNPCPRNLALLVNSCQQTLSRNGYTPLTHPLIKAALEFEPAPFASDELHYAWPACCNRAWLLRNGAGGACARSPERKILRGGVFGRTGTLARIDHRRSPGQGFSCASGCVPRSRCVRLGDAPYLRGYLGLPRPGVAGALGARLHDHVHRPPPRGGQPRRQGRTALFHQQLTASRRVGLPPRVRQPQISCVPVSRLGLRQQRAQRAPQGPRAGGGSAVVRQGGSRSGQGAEIRRLSGV